MSETYWTADCPACKTTNLVCGGDQNDQTSTMGDAFRCWSCGTVARLPQDAFDEGEEYEVAENQDSAVPDGTPPPAMTKACLEEIVAALGPLPGKCCPGCNAEMWIALEAAKRGLGMEAPVA